MVAPPGLTVIDSSVFVIDLRYHRDRHFASNRSFLDRVAGEGRAATTIFNLLEVCGIMSFNLSERQLKELFHYFARHYNVDVLPHCALENPLPPLNTEDLMNAIAKKASFGDALIISTVEKHLPGTARFVSWNARHFRGRISVTALTPREFLERF
jgi:predicted nucleic acid-binding protein